jgi:hypothetical protein
MWAALKDEQPALGHSASPPPCFEKAISRIRAPDLSRIDLGVMPLTRPDVSSDCVRLLDKLGTFVAAGRFISEYGAFDSMLLGDGVVDILSPDKKGISICCSEGDDLAGTNELGSLPAVRVVVAAVVSLIKFQARLVAIPCQIPKRFHLKSGAQNSRERRAGVPAAQN